MGGAIGIGRDGALDLEERASFFGVSGGLPGGSGVLLGELEPTRASNLP